MCCEGVCEGEVTMGDSYMLRYLTGWPLSSPDLMISALGTCRLSWRLKIFFKHQLSGGEIKQIIWQAVYIFLSIGWHFAARCRRADQWEGCWDNPSCQSVKTGAWWDPALARIIFWISFSPPAFIMTRLGLGNITHTCRQSVSLYLPPSYNVQNVLLAPISHQDICFVH